MKKVITIIIAISIILMGCTHKENIINIANQSIETERVPGTSKVVPPDSSQLATDTKNGMVIKSNKHIENFNTVGIESANSSNKGYIASDGSFIYFWSGTSYEIEDGKFCKMKHDGTQFSILSDDMPCSINIIDGTIYFVSQKYRDDNYGPIYRMDKDGANKTLLIDKDCQDLIVTDEFIYFINKSNGDKIFRADKNGGNLQVVANGKCDNLQYDNKYLYYELEKYNQLYRVKTDGTNKPTKLISKFYTYFVNRDNIYFLRQWTLHKYSVKEKKEYRLYKNEVYGMTFGNSMLYLLGYFDNASEGRGTFAYDIATATLDGKNLKIINSYKQNQDKTFPLYYFNNYIYYGVDRNEGANTEFARIKSDGTGEKYLGDYLLK